MARHISVDSFGGIGQLSVDSRSAVDSVDRAGAQQMTRRGRPVRIPKRYCLTIDSCPQCQLLKKGEVVRK